MGEKRFFRVLEFPKHLQTTLVALLKLGRATASDVAKLTGKARAVESACLNQLVDRKLISPVHSVWKNMIKEIGDNACSDTQVVTAS